MKRRNLLISLLGGIILMSTINGCTNNTNNHLAQSNQTSTSSGASRSPEEAALEGSFQPLFDFLAEEKKDFSNVKTYISGLSISPIGERDAIESYNLLLKKETVELSGTYTVEIDNQETAYPVKIDGEDTVQFTDQTPTEGLSPFVFQTISQEEIKELAIVDYTANHPETELKDISYSLPRTHPLVEILREKYGVQPTRDGLLTVTWRGKRSYRLNYSTIGKEYRYHVGLLIEFE